MIIRRIGLRNYRGIESRDIEFGAGVNIVEGPNEAGKTSLAEALGLIFDYPDSSAHRSVTATHPVHRDEGPEIDIELQTGPYELLYHKRYKRRPETTLEVRRPSPESLTGRDAHARAEEILNETIDVALWRALQLQQGLAIEQADLRDREALSRAGRRFGRGKQRRRRRAGGPLRSRARRISALLHRHGSHSRRPR